jgi:hypothetical protein
LKAQASQARRGGHLVIIIIIITTRLSLPPPSFPALTARSSLRYFIFQNIHVTSAPLAQLSDVDFGTRQSLVQRRIFHPNLDVKNRKMRGRLKRNGVEIVNTDPCTPETW